MDATSFVSAHVDKYRAGDRDSAFFGLIEARQDILPELNEAFRTEGDPDVRAFLIEVIWQLRCEEAIPTLAQALLDSDGRVWKEAFNGPVTLASPQALEALLLPSLCSASA